MPTTWRPPSFPLTVAWYFAGDPYPGLPRYTSLGALYAGKPQAWTLLYAGTATLLRVPFDTRIPDQLDPNGPGFVEVPAGSGVLYQFAFPAYEVARGFVNWYRAIMLTRYTPLDVP